MVAHFANVLNQGSAGVSMSGGGTQGPQGFIGPQGIAGPGLSIINGNTTTTTINATLTATSGGVTLTNQTATATGIWRIKITGQMTSTSSATSRSIFMRPIWGAAAITPGTPNNGNPVVAANTAQTSNFVYETILYGGSTTTIRSGGAWIDYAWSSSIGTYRLDCEPTTNAITVSSGPQTIDIQFFWTGSAVAGDSLSIYNILIECLQT